MEDMDEQANWRNKIRRILEEERHLLELLRQRVSSKYWGAIDEILESNFALDRLVKQAEA